jgi:hypothetical protein
VEKRVLTCVMFPSHYDLLAWVNKTLLREDVLTITRVGNGNLELWYWGGG